jgi:repressor LexA
MIKTRMKVLQFIKDFIQEKGYSPSYQEIATAVNLKSKAQVTFHIQKLEKLGLIKRAPNTFRSIRVVEYK